MKAFIFVSALLVTWDNSLVESACGGNGATCSIGLFGSSCCEPNHCSFGSGGTTSGTCKCSQLGSRCVGGMCCEGLECERDMCTSPGKPDGGECDKNADCYSGNCVLEMRQLPNERCTPNDCEPEPSPFCRGYCQSLIGGVCKCLENGITAAISSCPAGIEDLPLDQILKLCSYRKDSCCSGATNLLNQCVCQKVVGQTCIRNEQCCSSSCQNGVCV